MATADAPFSLTGLISQAAGRLASFARLSIELASAEIGYGFSTMIRGVIIGIVAGAMLFLSLVFLLLGLVQWLIAVGVAPHLAFLGVGAGLMLLTIVLLLVARSLIKGASLVPSRALAQVGAAVKAATQAPPHG